MDQRKLRKYKEIENSILLILGKKETPGKNRKQTRTYNESWASKNYPEINKQTLEFSNDRNDQLLQQIVYN